MIKEPLPMWDEESGIAIYNLIDGTNVFTGYAKCSENDRDMMSEKVGCQIALWRAEIKYYTHLRDNEIKPQIKALKELYYSMSQSKSFNPKSYENKMLQRQLRRKQNDLDTVQKELTTIKERLADYIDKKEKFYQRVRANRGQAKTN